MEPWNSGMCRGWVADTMRAQRGPPHQVRAQRLVVLPTLRASFSSGDYTRLCRSPTVRRLQPDGGRSIFPEE